MNDYAGESGGGSSAPTPNIEFEAVEMETVSVRALGEALIKDAANMKTAAEKINKQLENPQPEGDKLGQYAQTPIGADPRQETLHSIVTKHTERMDDTRRLLDSVARSIRNLGMLTTGIAAKFGDVDGLNATNLGEVKEIVDQARNSGSAGGWTDA